MITVSRCGWSKDAARQIVVNDPEVDGIDFYIEGPNGEYIPWKPTEGQKQMLSTLFGIPTRVAGKAQEDHPESSE